MFRRQSNSPNVHPQQRPRRVRVAHTTLTPMSPPISSAQNQAYTNQLAAIPRPLGGAMGCSYTGFDYGVVCQNTGGMPNYSQSPVSFVGECHANVKPGFPLPQVQRPGGYDQIMMGGGSGSPECAQACSCLGDSTCPCLNAPGQTCGYSSVNQTCVEPYPGGEYSSLSACEAANARGNYRM
jgi:hypothetical protein